MDWTAIGSIGALAAALVAYLQYRHSSRRETLVAAPLAQPTKPDPPILDYRIISGRGRYPLPDNWQVPISDERWLAQQGIANDLRQVNFGFVTLTNNNLHHVERVSLELKALHCWSAQVESTTSLAEAAVALNISKDSISILIDEMPSKEQVIISIFLGGSIGSMLRSANAAVKLKSKWD
jgi:hypothetical protein